MLAIVIANLIWTIPACAVCGIVGYAFRSIRINKLNRRVQELEREMLQNHAEILALQKENTDLLDKLNNPSVPVIPITGSAKENTENLPDVSARKKLLGTSAKKS
ncbi:MAG: hypothetical protein WCF67_18345 [Chitinophagaceae bacterium]